MQWPGEPEFPSQSGVSFEAVTSFDPKETISLFPVIEEQTTVKGWRIIKWGLLIL